MYGMVLSSIGDGGVHNRGVLWQCGAYNGSNPSLFGYSFCGPAYFTTRADKLLRVRMIQYACGYLYDLMLCKKIVLMF